MLRVNSNLNTSNQMKHCSNALKVFVALLIFSQATAMFLDLENAINTAEKTANSKPTVDSHSQPEKKVPEIANTHHKPHTEDCKDQPKNDSGVKVHAGLKAEAELLGGNKPSGLAHLPVNHTHHDTVSKDNQANEKKKDLRHSSKDKNISKKNKDDRRHNRKKSEEKSDEDDSMIGRIKAGIKETEKRVRHSLGNFSDHEFKVNLADSYPGKRYSHRDTHRRDDHIKHRSNELSKRRNHSRKEKTFKSPQKPKSLKKPQSVKDSKSQKKNKSRSDRCHHHKAHCAKVETDLKVCLEDQSKLTHDFKRLSNQFKLQTEDFERVTKALKETEIDNKKLREHLETEKKAHSALKIELNEQNQKHQNEIKSLMAQIARLKEINLEEGQKVLRLEKELVIRDKQIKEADENLKKADEVFAKKLKEQEVSYTSKLSSLKEMNAALKKNEKILVGASLE